MDELTIDETSVLISRRHGIPLPVRDNRHPFEKKMAVYLILASTIFERLAFYSLAINLIVTLKSSKLNWDNSNSTTASFIFLGTSYISALIFAVISDGKLGRAKTIIIGFILYFIGYIVIILIANDVIHESICKDASLTHDSVLHEHCGRQIIGTIVFMAIGIGAVQVNMAVFGAEQIQESKLTSRYFDKYYVAVNIGATIATLSIPLIQNDSDDPTYSNNYFYGYLIATFMLVAAAVLFIIGRQHYIHIPPYDTVITKCIPVVINAFQTWFKYRNNRQTRNRYLKDTISNDPYISRSRINQQRTMATDEQSLSFLDYAKAANNGKFNDRIVDDVKSLRRAIIVFILLIPYWIIYYQIQITFPLQGQQMYIPILYNNEKVPISWMSLGDAVTIIIGIIILTKFVYKYLDDRNRIISIKIKLIIGMILASLTMCIAGTVEVFRQNQCTNESYSNLTIYAQLPQNICMGLSEIFATVASLEFAYLAAPRSAQSLLMSLQFCSLGISSFISNGYLSIYPTTSNNFDFSCQSLNRWTFFTYFFILAGLQMAFLIIIILCDKEFQILKLNPQQIESQQFEACLSTSSIT